MLEGRLVRLRAFEQSDLDANHAFVNDFETLKGMLSGLPLPASYADERRWLISRPATPGASTNLRWRTAAAIWWAAVG